MWPALVKSQGVIFPNAVRVRTAKESIGEHPRTRSVFACMETLKSIEESSAARIVGTSTGFYYLGLEFSYEETRRGQVSF